MIEQVENHSKERLEDRIKLIIATHLDQDFDLGAFITITNVKLSGDFHHSYIYWTTLSPNIEEVSEKLDLVKGEFRTFLSKSIKMRRVPTVEFIHDKLPDQVSNYTSKFSELERRDKELEDLRKNSKPVVENPYRDIEDIDDKGEEYK